MLTGNLRRLEAQFLEWFQGGRPVTVTPEIARILSGRVHALAMLAEVMERTTPAPAVPPPQPQPQPDSNVVYLDFPAASLARDRRRGVTRAHAGDVA